jgi:hypothetical protein
VNTVDAIALRYQITWDDVLELSVDTVFVMQDKMNEERLYQSDVDAFYKRKYDTKG